MVRLTELWSISGSGKKKSNTNGILAMEMGWRVRPPIVNKTADDSNAKKKFLFYSIFPNSHFQ